MPNVYKHSRLRHFGHLGGCLVFVGIGVLQLSLEGTGSVMSWLSLLFFGGLALFYLVDLLNPKTRFLIPGSAEEKAYLGTTEGRYRYSPEGFNIDSYDEYEGTTYKHRVLWREIDEVKLRRTKYLDQVCEGLCIAYRNGAQRVVFETNETHEGYYILVERIRANLPGIVTDWELDEPEEVYQQTEKTLWRKAPNDP
jgi:hypothetical protein